ncbi:MAG TPA: hypothetical protein PLT52_02905 [Acetomicrobium sp.]|nr:hypothetical protein [Acetomicrobium sp.]HPT64833.1 hypothetical protein [Acetomicrobium sp.]
MCLKNSTWLTGICPYVYVTATTQPEAQKICLDAFAPKVQYGTTSLQST